MSANQEIRIFAGSAGKVFAEKMCDYLGIPLGETKSIKFSEGSIFVKIQEHVRGKEVYLVQPIGMNPNEEFVELLFWMDALKRSSAAHVTAVVPFFAYAKGDKKDEPRVSIRARVCAECIELAGADRVITMDLHASQIQGFFKKPVDHLYALPILCEYFKTLDVDNYIVVSPDAGFAKNARNFANHLGVNLAIAEKMRSGHDEKAEVLNLIGDVTGKNVLVVDDFSISGGTLVDLSRVLKAHGAKRIFVCLSHLMLQKDAVKRIEDSPIELVIGTDSVVNPYIIDSPKIKTVSVAPLFAEAARRMHNAKSISSLFKQVPAEVFEYSINGEKNK